MSTALARRLARGSFGASLLLLAAGATLSLFSDPSFLIAVLVIGLTIAGYGFVGMLVASRRPRNPIGWLFCAVALALGIWAFGGPYAQFHREAGDGFGTLPGSATAAWLSILVPTTVITVALPAFLLLFPDGGLRSRRWRLALVAAVGGAPFVLVGMAATVDRYNGSMPLVPPDWLLGMPAVGGFTATGALLAAGAAFAGLLSLVLRFRAATGEDREQLRLLVAMLTAMAVVTALAVPLSWPGVVLMLMVDGFGVLIGIPAATAAAVLTFGLYDVGVVVKKTIVYGLLVALLALLLALLAFVLSSFTVGGGRDSAARVVSVFTIVGLGIAAGWRWVKRMANRLVYGKRATPYEVVSEFSDRLGETYSTEDVLPRMAEILRASTGAEVARVWLRLGSEMRAEASSPVDVPAATGVVVVHDDLPEMPGRAFPVRDHGDLLGAVTVEMPSSEPLRGAAEKLVADLASQAGLVLRNVRLTEELKQSIEELRASRQRIVTAQDDRARKLERDIHDGAQQHLVALGIKLRLADGLVGNDDERARAMLAELQAEASDALENLRDLARGIYPPLLADEGLAAALEAQARKSPFPVSIETDGVGRYPQEAEAALYFCALEALQNVAKHGRASGARVRIAQSRGTLTLQVEDDGEGFDPSATGFGTGLQGMADRLAAQGGKLEVRSTPGLGTTVLGSVPVEVRVT